MGLTVLCSIPNLNLHIGPNDTFQQGLLVQNSGNAKRTYNTYAIISMLIMIALYSHFLWQKREGGVLQCRFKFQ